VLAADGVCALVTGETRESATQADKSTFKRLSLTIKA
jgi:hypothetical protein